jgi:hypothetical protein
MIMASAISRINSIIDPLSHNSSNMSSSPRSPPSIILGAGGIGDASDPTVGQSTPEAAQDFLNIYRGYGYNRIDTARGYTPQ